MRFDCWGATDVGRVRDANEDSIRVDGERRFLMVADGVGGGAAGEVASAMAVDVVHRHLAAEVDLLRAAGGGDPQAARYRLTQRLGQAFADASAAIYERSQADPAQRGMCTTGVVLQVLDSWALVGHVGDSRVYLIRDGVPHQVTEDHSLARLLLARGALTPEQAATYPKNTIVRAVGTQPTVEADVVCFDILPGDTILLCSDGMSDPVPPAEIAQLSRAASAATAVQALIARANQRGGPDNISVVLACASGDMPKQPSVRMEVKIDLLQHVPLFRDLTFQEAARMLGYVEEQRFAAGQVIFREGDAGDAVYIVAEGDVEVSQGGMVLTVVGRGGHFGELGLVTDGVRSATARARGPTAILAIGRDSLLWLVRHDHALATKLLWGFLRNLADRVKTLSTQLSGARKA